MPLTFHPDQGMLLICNYETGFVSPEMVKTRPVVVVSPRRRNDVCLVVPLSTVRPATIEPYHHMMDPASLPGKYAATETWAKCDMVAAVALSRLDRVLVHARGRRQYVSPKVTPADLKAIQEGVLEALGLARLVHHL